MRYHVKGGTWKNVEDEILKASVMKYGLNQWSRVSSLLVRKSAKQCKERWYEWLDPKIKKTPWTKDEEEKLLNLAKMFPCQWKTIAPFVGRTAFQCIEHYEYLLDTAQGRVPSNNDPRKLRPGEVDPNPEARPARPDPIDLDEDMKETLNEARARVANTRGKKAKRKIREKQLEEARRLAALQKKRELKSAGIEITLRLPKKKKKEMNYNVDIPFKREVPIGSWSEFLEDTPGPDKFKAGISLQVLDNRNRDIEEEKQRKIDDKRMKDLKNSNLPKAFEMINKVNDRFSEIRRKKIDLPESNISENELREIKKITNNNLNDNKSNINMSLDYLKRGSENILSVLSSEIRTPLQENKIEKEAKIAYDLKESETPLLGGENSKQDLNNFLENMKSQNKKNEKNNNNNDKGFKTPLPVGNYSIMRTPGSHLNNVNFSNDNESSNNEWENNLDISGNSLNVSRNMSQKVKSLFENLPKPKNEIELIIDDDDDEDKIDENVIGKDLMEIEKDGEDVLKEKIIKEKIDKEIKEKLKSEVVRKNLPRIHLNDKNWSLYENNLDNINQSDNELISEINKLINEEMFKLINNDNKKIEEYNITLKEKEEIEKMIDNEVKLIKKKSNEELNQLREKYLNENILFLGNEKGFINKDNSKYLIFEEKYKNLNSQYQKQKTYNDKLKNKTSILTNGYIMNYNKCLSQYKTLYKELNELNSNKELYENILKEEGLIYFQRKSEKEQELNNLNKIIKNNELNI
jgi:pre-mRNA-splicing factor CDC5/CEF1